MRFNLTNALKKRIRGVIFKRLEGFEDYLGSVDIEKGISWDGDPCLRITIHVRKDLDVEAFSDKSLGMGVDIQDAMGVKYEDIFPYLHLKSFEVRA